MTQIEINKENILFEDHMNYDTGKREKSGSIS